MRTMVEQTNHLSPNFILFIFFISSTLISATPTCNKIDQASLWSSFNMPPYWSSNDCCKWEGITCDTAGRVKHISLPSKGLKLEGGFFLSSSLGNLTHLTLLNLSHNSLYGSLDQIGFFSSLSRLEILDLSYNFLFGELPFSLPSGNMRRLDLSSNHFNGSIPSSFFQQAWNLTSFNVSNNTFSGSIPSSICLHSIPLIHILDFSFNNFNGSISGELGKCSKLQIFRAAHNNLSGILPIDIYNATKLEEISLPQNSLYGDISERIVNLATLKTLDLNSNGFSGMLPISIAKLSKLKLLLLHFNNLKGSLPLHLMNCTNLIELNLGYNNLEGNISVLNFSKLNQLTKLDLVGNYLTGTIPRSLYSCKSLKAIRISHNKLEGEIHPDILSLTSLSFLSLGYNRLTNITGAMKILMYCKSLVFLAFPASFVGEEMPDLDMVDFDGFQNLRFLALEYCELIGHIPTYLSKLGKLEVLHLSNNRITGSIPSWLGNLSRLYTIDLSSNLLSGEFPKELCRLPMLVSKGTEDQVDGDELELPVYVNQGASVLQYKWSYFPIAICINNNTISGSIPVEIGQLQHLHRLDLSNNNLSGNIPDQVSNLKSLERLDLSMNNLSGKIPLSFTRLTFLNFFNVSYNNLEGSIPASTQLQSFNASAFEGNTNLCGAPLPKKCLLIEDKDANSRNSRDDVGNDDESQIPWLHIFVALGFIVGFWGVFGPLVLKQNWRYAYFQFLDRAQVRLYACDDNCIRD
ncbi:receptor-like protein 2 [Rosa rugosa]|uniref:receptor-like protein 2 n=1 Tax=Rosa rugosa TaxID=74645 RepID=UPI002B4047F8|nr:receptor-like protein 2 [Rosa rugosa]